MEQSSEITSPVTKPAIQTVLFWQILTLLFASLFILQATGYLTVSFKNLGGQPAQQKSLPDQSGQSDQTGSDGMPLVQGVQTSDRELIEKLIPKEGSSWQNYSWQGSPITFTADGGSSGYKKLVAMDKEIADLSASEKTRFDKLTTEEIYHPCCDGPVQGCECEHAVALRGLVKFMLKEGKNDDEIKKQSFEWLKYFFQQHYVNVAKYLQNQGKDIAMMGPGKEFGLASYGAKVQQALQGGVRLEDLPQQKGGC